MTQENSPIKRQDEELEYYLKDVEKDVYRNLGVMVKLHVEKVRNRIDMDFITSLVSNTLSIPFDKIINSSKGKMEISAARHISIWLIRKYIPRVTLAEIGRFFKRDHTTIMYAISNIEGLLSVKDADSEKILKCENALIQLIENFHENQLR